MRLRWTPPAVAELEEICDYLWSHYPAFAQTTMQTLYNGVRSLRNTPYRGRHGTKPGTRELLFVPLPYLAIYRVDKDAIEILGFRHTSRESL